MKENKRNQGMQLQCFLRKAFHFFSRLFESRFSRSILPFDVQETDSPSLISFVNKKSYFVYSVLSLFYFDDDTRLFTTWISVRQENTNESKRRLRTVSRSSWSLRFLSWKESIELFKTQSCRPVLCLLTFSSYFFLEVHDALSFHWSSLFPVLSCCPSIVQFFFTRLQTKEDQDKNAYIVLRRQENKVHHCFWCLGDSSYFLVEKWQ